MTTPVPLAPITEDDAIHPPDTSTTANAATTGNNNTHHGPSNDRSEDTTRSNGLPFPPPFFDAVTGNLLEFPVVNPEGNSVEKMPGMDEQTYYPNRALQAIITKELSLSENSLTGSLRRWQSQLQTGWSQLVDQSAFPHEHRPLPEAFYCMIACELMLDPVITPSGQTYEREAIQQWIAANGTSPTTREPLAMSDLRPNHALYDLIQLEKKRTDESIHPSIRRWKESGVPSQRPDIEQQQQQQQQPPSGEATTTSTAAGAGVPPERSSYPTTLEGIQQRRRERRRIQLSCGMILIAIVVVVLLGPYLGASLFVWILILSVACRCFACCWRATG